MATRNPTAPARAGERLRSPSSTLYVRQAPVLEPDEHAPGSADDWRFIAPVRPDTAHVRAPRFLDLTGELASAILIIAGACSPTASCSWFEESKR